MYLNVGETNMEKHMGKIKDGIKKIHFCINQMKTKL